MSKLERQVAEALNAPCGCESSFARAYPYWREVTPKQKLRRCPDCLPNRVEAFGRAVYDLAGSLAPEEEVLFHALAALRGEDT